MKSSIIKTRLLPVILLLAAILAPTLAQAATVKLTVTKSGTGTIASPINHVSWEWRNDATPININSHLAQSRLIGNQAGGITCIRRNRHGANHIWDDFNII
jgi:hypothetical protein